MSDTYSQLVNNPVGGFVAKNLGLPRPVELDRYEPGAPLIDGRVLVGAAPGGRCGEAVAAVLAEAGTPVDSRLDDGWWLDGHRQRIAWIAPRRLRAQGQHCRSRRQERRAKRGLGDGPRNRAGRARIVAGFRAEALTSPW